MELWFTEDQTKDVRISCRVKKVLFSGRSQFQEVAVYDTDEYGRLLALDNIIQTNIRDEFIYHESLTHVGLNTHPNPQKVLLIGGGDGGSVREIVKHKDIEKIVHVEIDQMVIDVAKEFFPELSSGFSDPRVEIIVDDGIKHVKEHKNTYDVIMVDSPDPIGPAVGLYGDDFYRNVAGALKEDGLLVAQTESPFFNRDLISRVNATMKSIFPIVRMFLGIVPTYPGGAWTFTVGSKKYDPLEVDTDKLPNLNTKWYSPEMHRSVFVLPPFFRELIRE
ncbi:polyamine aminopropyltransferase [Desulfotruncus alcoholivorax]|uniref:polyamine aminopropyltransferase n=1 Tax=Desulfotruncus alcoholivorax TaxID=265477 RepID=UPI00047FC030|nr:polyamine aminopropyltransferase [Desulfotruncus alcoholivorax]